MPGMSMGSGGGPVQFAVRDVDGRRLELPGGRPGVMVFVGAERCAPCLAAVRAAARVVQRSGGRAPLIVVIMDAATGRNQVKAFARSAGAASARYVVDDRNGSVQTMLGAPAFGTGLVYDARGRIVSRPHADSRRWARALRRATR